MEAQPPGENNGKREARKCQERGAACIRKYPKAKHQGRESSVCYFRILAVSDNSSFQFSFALPCLVSFQRIPLSHFPSKATLYSARPGDRPLRKAPAQGSCLPHSTTSAVQNLSLAVKRNIFLGQRHPIEHLFYSIATLARFLVSSDLQSPHST